MWRRPLFGAGLTRAVGALGAIGAAAAVALTTTGAAPGILHIRVHRGDTLWGIARDHHTTVDRLRKLNHIPADSDLILAGQLLAVPGNGAEHAPRHAAPAHTARHAVHYVVRSGDNVTAIARHFGVSVHWVMNRNRLPASGLIVPGQRLVVGRRTTHPSPAAPGGRHYPAAVTAAAAHDRAILAYRAVPTRAQARRLVVTTAHRYGVDPALALALADMESGFNQRAVSPADAIGIMQVLPSTGRWLSDSVMGRRLDLLDAADNVRAGVRLLDLLTEAAPLRQAVAGYYQGLASVRQHGMFADTKVYVADVLALRHRFGGR